MFREIRFYDDYTDAVAAPWWMFSLLGLNFLLLGVLIVLFPQLLAYLAAAILFFNGLVLLLIAWKFWRFKKRYRQWREKLWLP
jgi:cytochrome c biogenesis protein CcdA